MRSLRETVTAPLGCLGQEFAPDSLAYPALTSKDERLLCGTLARRLHGALADDGETRVRREWPVSANTRKRVDIAVSRAGGHRLSRTDSCTPFLSVAIYSTYVKNGGVRFRGTGHLSLEAPEGGCLLFRERVKQKGCPCCRTPKAHALIEAQVPLLAVRPLDLQLTRMRHRPTPRFCETELPR